MTKIALITGTSSGMGLHAAIALAKAGATVVATVRSFDKAGELNEAAAKAGVTLDVRELDVTDHGAGEKLVNAVVEQYGRLDVLVNNAGRGCVATAETLDMLTIKEQMETNYFSAVALTQAALPHMRKATSGTILTVTSVGGAVGQPFADAYCGAKFAVEGFMQSLSTVAAAFDIKVSVIEPAAVATNFVDNVQREDAGPYADLLAAYMKRTEGAFANAQSAESAGEAIAGRPCRTSTASAGRRATRRRRSRGCRSRTSTARWCSRPRGAGRRADAAQRRRTHRTITDRPVRSSSARPVPERRRRGPQACAPPSMSTTPTAMRAMPHHIMRVMGSLNTNRLTSAVSATPAAAQMPYATPMPMPSLRVRTSRYSARV